MNKAILLFAVFTSSLITNIAISQAGSVAGNIWCGNLPVASATIQMKEIKEAAVADNEGSFVFTNIPVGTYTILISSVGFYSAQQKITVKENETAGITVQLATDNTILNTVIVTGVSKATLIKENPVAISLVSTKQLMQTAESNLIDALSKNVTGLNVVKTGPNISKPFIRGLGYNRVLTLYDGMRQEGQQWGDEHGIEVDAYHIAKAEVIKGPASLQYGSDAVAGVVSLFPFVPNYGSYKLTGSITSEYQSNNNLSGNGFRTSYSTDHFLVAVNGSIRLAGNYRNAADGRVYNTGFFEKNLSLLTGIKVRKGYSHLSMTLYDNLQGIPDGSRDSAGRRFTKQVSEGEQDDIKNRPAVSGTELNSYQLSPLHQHIQHYRIYTHHVYQLGKGDIDALIGVQQNIRREYNHPTEAKQAGMYVRLNTVNYNIRYTAADWKRISMTAGVNGMLQSNKSLDATDFPIPDYYLFDMGVYVYGKWKKEKWTISGGIRNDVRSVSWDDFYTGTNSANGFAYHAIHADTINEQLQFPAYRKQFHGVSASFGFTYKVDDHISVKANIGRGYRAPSITETGSNGLDPGAHIIYLGNRKFVPEFSLQEDFGVNLNYRDLSGDISLFNNNISHYIYLSLLADESGNAVTDAQGNRTFRYQQASAQLHGAEAWISYHPHSVAGLGFDNSLAMVYGFNRKSEYKNAGDKGQFLPLIPPLKIVSSVAKRISFTSKLLSDITVKIESEYNSRQNRFLGLNGTETATPSYLLLHAGVVSNITCAKEKSLQLIIQVNNVANTVYQSHLSRLKYFEYYTNSPNGRSGIYSTGRNVCIKLVVPF